MNFIFKNAYFAIAGGRNTWGGGGGISGLFILDSYRTSTTLVQNVNVDTVH